MFIVIYVSLALIRHAMARNIITIFMLNSCLHLRYLLAYILGSYRNNVSSYTITFSLFREVRFIVEQH